MRVTVHDGAPDRASVEIELAPHIFLLVNVHIPHDGSDSQFKRVFNARVRKTGPRGGDRGEPRSIGYGVLDIREEVVRDG